MFCFKQVMIGTSKNIWGFDPRSVPGCALWLDPADTSSVTLNGANVSQLRDKSGLGYNMSQTTAGNQPTYSTALNGNRMLTFTQASSTRLSNVSFPAFIGAGPASYFLVEYNMTAPSGNPGPFGYSAGPNFGLIMQYNPGFTGGLQPFSTGVSSFTSVTPRLIFLYKPNVTSSNMTGFINGTSQTVSDTTSGTYSGTFSVGSGTNGFISGNICELIVFNTALTTAQRQQIEGYLTWKWVLSGFSTIPNPLSVPGCVLWLDASDASTITLSGSSITQWNDKSAAGNNMTPFSTFSNATVSSNFQNQLNVLNFSANGVYRGPTSTGPYPADVYLVMALKDTTTHADVITVHSSNAGSTFNSLTFGEYTASRWHNGSDGFARTPNVVSPSNETSTAFLLINWSVANNNYLIRRNGVQLIQTTSYTYTRPADSRFQIGFRANPAVFSPASTAGTFRGYIGEIVAFNSQLSYDQQRQVEIYLRNKWGLTSVISSLPSTHPYSSLRPHLTTFRPFDVPGCELWFDGGDYRTMFQNTAGTTPVTAAGQSVARWNDKIRNLSISNTGVPGQSMLAPTSVSGGGVFFNNTSTTVSASAQGLGNSLTGATNQTAFLFRMPNRSMTMITASLPLSNNLLRQICCIDSSPNGAGNVPNFTMGHEIGAGNGGTILFDWNGSAWGQIAQSTSGYNSNTVLRIDSLVADSNPIWLTNGTSNTFTQTNTYTTANSNYPVNRFAMGGYSSTFVGSRNFHGNIYEMLLYSRVLTTGERQQVEGYLAHKWGLSTSLPAAHLYRTIPAALVVPPVVDPLTNSGSQDVFVVKYDSSGTPLWARRLGGTGIDQAFSVSTDSSGNIVVAGQYASNPLNIFAANGTTVSFALTNSGGAGGTNDCFVVKYDSSGTPLWARRMGGTGEDRANSVTTDSSGNIVVSGHYSSNPLNIFAANGTTVSFTLANSGSNEAFVVKYDSSGTPLWARRLGGTGSDQAFSVSTDSSGNVVVAGYYASNPLNIFAANGTTVVFTLTNSGSFDVFVVKYDSSGTPLWARRISGTSNDFAYSVSTDSSGNIIVTGDYASTTLNIFAANGSTVSFTLANTGGNDVFVVKYDSSGTPLWARRLGGTGGDQVFSVSTDSSGNVVVAGYYTSNPLNIFAANGSTVSFTLANTGGFDVFIVKYDSSGTPLWARRIGGTNNDYAWSVTTDSSGNIVVSGQYASNPLSIFAANGTTVSFTLANSGSDDAFVVKYDSSGIPLWARILGGTGSEFSQSVSTDSSQNIVVAGQYSSTSLSFYG